MQIEVAVGGVLGLELEPWEKRMVLLALVMGTRAWGRGVGTVGEVAVLMAWSKFAAEEGWRVGGIVGETRKEIGESEGT